MSNDHPRLWILPDVVMRLLEVETYHFLPFMNYFYLGFLAYRSLNQPIDDCINAACYCAYECLSQIGCRFPTESSFNPRQRYCNIY
jgi:hypothetical protein